MRVRLLWILFGLFQRLLFDHQPLPFVPVPRAAPFQDHRRERRMLYRSKPLKLIHDCMQGRKLDTIQLLSGQYIQALEPSFRWIWIDMRSTQAKV